MYCYITRPLVHLCPFYLCYNVYTLLFPFCIMYTLLLLGNNLCWSYTCSTSQVWPRSVTKFKEASLTKPYDKDKSAALSSGFHGILGFNTLHQVHYCVRDGLRDKSAQGEVKCSWPCLQYKPVSTQVVHFIDWFVVWCHWLIRNPKFFQLSICLVASYGCLQSDWNFCPWLKGSHLTKKSN